MESPDVSDAGYPEEQPDQVVPDGDESGKTGSDVEERARPSKDAERAPDNDDGTATGGG